MRITRLLMMVFAVAMLARTAPANAAAPNTSLAHALNEIIAMEARVAPIARRLATGAAPWCPALAPTPGWLLGDRRLYDARLWPMVRAAYAASDADAPFVAALDPSGPAAAAGLRVGDAILAIGGRSAESSGASPHARIAAAHALISTHPANAGLSITIARRSAPVLLPPTPGCASEFRVEAHRQVKAEADGTTVYVSAAMIRLAADDTELAAIVAHELAHNILRHRARLDAAGITRGVGRQFGRSARLTKATEVEADRLAVWLLEDAGYGADVASRFWTRYGQQRSKGIFSAATHPRWRERVASVTAEAALLRRLRTADRRAVPPLIANPPPLE